MKNAIVVSALTLALGAAGSSAMGELVYGVTLNQTLVSFNSNTPATLLSGVAISGLAPNESVHGIDFRPATGELYALGSFSRLYRVNTTTGAATQVGGVLSTQLNGSSLGFDFNPTVDRIRVVSDVDQNLRLHPVTGAVASVDGSLAYVAGDPNFGANPNVVAAAYTNSFAGALTTTLYVLDTHLDILAIQNPPNAGGLVTVGSLGTDLSDMASFDISGASGVAYAAVRDVLLARTTFWTINLSNGSAGMIGEVGGGAILTAMAVVPAPGAAALLGLALIPISRRHR